MGNQIQFVISLACVLLGLGVVMVHSASITSWPTHYEQVYLSRHLTFLLLGAVVATVCGLLPSRLWMAAAPALFAVTVLLLMLVLVPSAGTRVNGAQRWFRFGSLSFQPSELVRLSLPLLVARMLYTRHATLLHPVKGTVPFLIPIALVLPLVIVEPDLGSAAFFAVIYLLTLFVGGWPLRNFVVPALLGIPAAMSLLVLKPYQVERISGFVRAWSDLNDAPWQLRQSLMSLGTGGISGVGIGRGWQKLSFLPEANTDFVFAVVGEELGLVGTLSLLIVWAAFYGCGLRLLAGLPVRSFERIAATILLTQLVLQAALNMAVVTALVPPKGIPHPFLSYGGSNLVTSLASLGIVISLSRAPQQPCDSVAMPPGDAAPGDDTGTERACVAGITR